MNVLNRLQTDVREKNEATALEQLILDCKNEHLQLEAAAEYYQLIGRATFKNLKDMTELKYTEIP